MTSANDLMKQMKDDSVEYLDLRFTDPRGKMQHVTLHQSQVNEDLFADGAMFDGSSIAGWKAINESDMTLMPDTETAYMDPFYAHSTMAIFCDILDPMTGEGYNRDPRMTAKRAEAYIQSGGFRRHGLFRPRARILHLRRRALFVQPIQNGLRGRFRRAADQYRQRIRSR